jgi:hypothetical protein
VLVNLPSRSSVYWYSHGMACLRGPSIAPRLGASDLGSPGHRPGLTGGIDGDMTAAGGWAATVLNADIAIRFAFSSRPAGTGFA